MIQRIRRLLNRRRQPDPEFGLIFSVNYETGEARFGPAATDLDRRIAYTEAARAGTDGRASKADA